MRVRILKSINRLSLICLVLAASAVLLFTSCLPEWLEDSKSFVYFEKNKLMIRDIEAQTSRELVSLETEDGEPLGPVFFSLRPDRKQLVLARLDQIDGKANSVILDFYDLVGKKLISSEPIELENANALEWVFLNWTDDAKYLLVDMIGSQATYAFDVEKQSFRKLEESSSLFSPIAAFSTSPIVPGTHRYIAKSSQDNKPVFWLVSLVDGSKEKFDATQLPDDMQELYQSTDATQFKVRTSRFWKSNKTFVEPINEGQVLFNTAAMKVTYEPTETMSELSEIAEKNEAIIIYQINEDLIVQTDEIPDGEISIYNIDTGKTVGLNGNEHDATVIGAVKSADSKHTVVSFWNDQLKMTHVVVDARGEVVDEFSYPLLNTEN